MVAFTYGAFYAVDRQTGENTIASTCFDVTFSDGSSINLSGALPVSDNVGIYQDPYEFSLTNNCTYDMSYKIVVNVPSTSINNSQIKFMYDGFDIGLISDMEPLDEVQGYQIPRVIGTGVLKARTKITRELRFWLYENTPIEDVKNKSWNAEIKIISSVNKADR